MRRQLRPPLGNRIGIGLVGLALIGAGGGLLAARADHALAGRSVEGIVDPGAAGPWAWPVGAGAALLVALVATRWLACALGWRRRGCRTGAGIAMLGVALKGVDGVSRVQVRLVGDRRMRVSVTLSPHADLAEVIDRLGESAISRVRRAVDRPHLPALVRLHVRRR